MIGVLAGAALLGLVVLGAVAVGGGRLPTMVAGAVAFACAGIRLHLLPDVLPKSRWRIPQSWARFGSGPYAGMFGAVLGVALLTAVPTCFYALLAWSASDGDFTNVMSAFLGFGVARSAPVMFAAMHHGPAAEVRALDRVLSLGAKGGALEVVVLIATAVALLLG